MKTLVVVVHPDLKKSVVNKRWVEELNKHPDRYTVHKLHEAYPDGVLDVKREQALVESHGNLVWQFPFYWFNCPPLLKKWLDDVLQSGWAYGANAKAFRGRKVAVAASAGIRQDDFTADGKSRFTLGQLLRPFEATCDYMRADYRQHFAFYGATDTAEDPAYASRVEKSAADYLRFLSAI